MIFQSTHPTRECDIKKPSPKKGLTYFNPRTLQESATHDTLESIDGELAISIHAPYKRVRHQAGRRIAWRDPDFNPRTLQESATTQAGQNRH